MVETLILHLGDRKTGSTAIQNALSRGTWTSDRGTIFFPGQSNHNPLAKTLYNKKEAKNLDARFTRVSRMIEASDADVAVLSAENFESADPKVVKSILDTYLPGFSGKTRLIVYVRPHVDRMLSGFAERTKQGGFFGTLDAFHTLTKQRGSFIYHDRFKAWRAEFGDALEIRLMIRDSLHKKCVVHDFLRFALHGAEVSWQSDSFTNESLTMADLAVLRMLMKELGGKKADRAVAAMGWEFSRTLGALPLTGPAVKPALHKSLVASVRKTYARDAEKMDKSFFTGTPMRDALEAGLAKAIDEPQPVGLHHYVSAEELRRLKGMIAMIEKMFRYAPDAESWGHHFRDLRAGLEPVVDRKKLAKRNRAEKRKARRAAGISKNLTES